MELASPLTRKAAYDGYRRNLHGFSGPSAPSLLSSSSLSPRTRTARSGVVMAGRGLKELISISGGKKKSKRPRIKPGSVSPAQPIPGTITLPPWAKTGKMPGWTDDVELHPPGTDGYYGMRAACQLAANVLEAAGSMVQAGVTTEEIDKRRMIVQEAAKANTVQGMQFGVDPSEDATSLEQLSTTPITSWGPPPKALWTDMRMGVTVFLDTAVHELTIAAGAYPSPLNYGNFPKSVCTSVNEVICHGIPDSRELQDGDIINIDVTVFLNGFHGDTSRMFFVGTPGEEASTLVRATHEGLHAAIKECGPGVPLKRIGKAISDVAESYRLGVIRDFVGHGVGRVFHAAPAVMHHRNNEPGVLQPWQTLTIEPMLSVGSIRPRFWKDEWTAVTADGSLTAQFEHTVQITEDAAQILTLPSSGLYDAPKTSRKDRPASSSGSGFS